MLYKPYYHNHYYTPAQQSRWGYIDFTLSAIRPSSHVYSSAYSFGLIHFIFMLIIKQLQKVCCMYRYLQNFNILNFDNLLKFVILTLSSLD